MSIGPRSFGVNALVHWRKHQGRTGGKIQTESMPDVFSCLFESGEMSLVPAQAAMTAVRRRITVHNHLILARGHVNGIIIMGTGGMEVKDKE